MSTKYHVVAVDCTLYITLTKLSKQSSGSYSLHIRAFDEESHYTGLSFYKPLLGLSNTETILFPIINLIIFGQT
jgi:hypothetical protein